MIYSILIRAEFRTEGHWLQLPRVPVFWEHQNFVVGNLLTCELLNF
jgi:hypothetical protein